MRFIGDLDDSRQAQNFSAYLLVKGIETQVDELEAGTRFEIWVKDEDQCDAALADLKAFQLNPSDSKYAEAVQQAQVLVRAEEKKTPAGAEANGQSLWGSAAKTQAINDGDHHCMCSGRLADQFW